MTKAKVYFSKEISPEIVVKMYEKLGIDLPGKVAVKVHSGEKGNQNFLRPELTEASSTTVSATIRNPTVSSLNIMAGTSTSTWT